MKKVFKSLVAGVVTFSMLGGAASAQINNTGPGSNNQINNNNTSNTTTSNSTVCILSSTSNQGASSGGSNVSGNTSGGSATSGSASNSNTANGSCAVGYRAVPANSPEAKAAAQRVAPVGGRGAGQPVDAAGRVLPATGVDETVRNAAIGIASLAGVAGVAVAGTSLYRRRALI